LRCIKKREKKSKETGLLMDQSVDETIFRSMVTRYQMKNLSRNNVTNTSSPRRDGALNSTLSRPGNA
jgi:hypothetical protein